MVQLCDLLCSPQVQFRALFALINLVTVAGVSQLKSPSSADELVARVVRSTSSFVHSADVAGQQKMQWLCDEFCFLRFLKYHHLTFEYLI